MTLQDLTEAMDILVPNAKYRVIDGVIDWQDERPQPSDSEIQAKIEELKAQQEIDVLYSDLNSLCDKESREARKSLVGWEASGEQVSRYKEKARIAKDNSLHHLLDEEATERGIETSELADLIKVKAIEWDEAVLTSNSSTEAFRVKVQTLIKTGQYDEARDAIKARGGN